MAAIRRGRAVLPLRLRRRGPDQTPLGPDRPEGDEAPEPGADSPPDRRSVVAGIKKGFQVIGGDGFLRYTTGWVAVTNLVGNSFLLLLVALLSDRGAAPELIGITNAGALSGGIIGAMLAGAILKRLPALRVFQLGGWIYFLSLALAAVSPAPWQIGLAAAVFAFTSAPMVTVWESYTVRRVPDRLTGRVLSASAFCAQSLAWIGMLMAGWLSDTWGASAAALCFGAILVPFAVAGHMAKSLTLLRHPAEQIDEVSDGPGAP